MTWKTEFYCVFCNHIISWRERMYSYGRCPYCGKKHENACTVMETYEKAYRWKKVGWFKWTKEYLDGPD